jgi:DNA-binding response OmpR family regulator
LTAGEIRLLEFLGARPRQWHSSYDIAVRAFGRQDASARQLVWKYASTLRAKTAAPDGPVIESSRLRGYQGVHSIVTVD